MQLIRLATAVLLVFGLAACGGIVNFAPGEGGGCEDKTCGEECEGGGICTEDGTCSLSPGDVVCPPACVLGECGDACTICEGESCVSGFCSEDGLCVEGGVTCSL